ncbi:putative pentatricopeptide repeat-containing protein At5g08310, mitochondrial isoform X2 [Cucurbita maxima]|uniref:Pentatricopeptide repeat-containing protein At5g08310, mitochondrial isoform X2 n=1 Tax=Cucurbita maxima TaxID=3661 RepID=A0A6J1JSS2_CUCMA|nr:putative pentatricopeptide repeat-containing protein At5g08310, mitochondrial isoform X2 [Cucurbita maxima]
MALSRITFANQSLWKSVNFTNSVAFISVFSESLSPVVVSQSYRPICSDAINVIPSHDESHISNNFISLFSQRKISPDDPELKILAPRLNTQIVENVLNGLRNWKVAHMFFIWASKQHGYRHNCYTFNVIASILSHARQNAPLRAIAMDVINSRCSMTPGALGIFLRCLGSVGLVEEANFLFDQVRVMGLCVPNSYTYNCLLEILSKANAIDSIENRLREMKYYGCEVDKYTLTPVLKAYCNTGKFDKALNVYNDIHERGWIDGYVFSILVLAFSKWGEVDRAMELIERTGDQNPWLTEKTFYALIHGFVKESREDMAIKLLEKMKKLGFPPDISIYDVLIGGLCKKGSFEKAMTLFWKMKLLGITPDIEILAKLIASSSEERAMIMLLEERPKDVNDEGMILLYNSVLTCFVNAGSLDKACYLLGVTVESESHSDDIHICELHQTFKNVVPNTASFGIVIDGLLKMDKLEESYKILRDMKQSGLQPTHFTHNSIFGCLCRREDIVGATELLREMRGHGHEPWIKHSTLLVKQLCKNGRVNEACNFLGNMVREGFLPDIVAYSAAMDGLVKIHEVDRAFEMFQDICTHGYQPDVVAYNVLINGLCKSGRVNEAEDFLNKMIVAGLVPTVVTYNLLIDGWCKSGDIDQAIRCLSRMNGENREPTIITYTTLIDGCCNSGRPDDAEILWNEMQQKGCFPNRIAYMAIVHGLCKCGRPDEALVYYHRMEEKEMKPDSYVSVAVIDALVSKQNFPMALNILEKMVETGKVPDPADKNYVTIRDAIFKLSEDERTGPGVRSLIEKGSIPTISISDLKR